jgi:large subunit ribosomal protein L37Ae
MAKTAKVGIVGKYGARYGASIRKVIKKIEISQHSAFSCPLCGKDRVKRTHVGIWKCRHCKTTFAGGAYSLSTPTAVAVRAAIRRQRDLAGTALY